MPETRSASCRSDRLSRFDDRRPNPPSEARANVEPARGRQALRAAAALLRTGTSLRREAGLPSGAGRRRLHLAAHHHRQDPYRKGNDMNHLLPLLILAAFSTSAIAQGPSGPASHDPATVQAGTYKVDPNHTQVTFGVSHMGFSEYRGRFSGVGGSLEIDPRHAAAAGLDVQLPVSSVSTTSGEARRRAQERSTGSTPRSTRRCTSSPSRSRRPAPGAPASTASSRSTA